MSKTFMLALDLNPGQSAGESASVSSSLVREDLVASKLGMSARMSGRTALVSCATFARSMLRR